MRDRRRDPLLVARLHARERASPGGPAREHDRASPAASSSAKRGSSSLHVGQQEPVDAPRGREPLVGGQRRAAPRPARAAAAARSRRRSARARSRTGSARRTSRPRAAPRLRASTSPIARVRASVSARALADGCQPSSRAAARIRSRVPDETPGRSLTANETAAADTPARRATSTIVGRRRGRVGPGATLQGPRAPLPAYIGRGSRILSASGEREACGGRERSACGSSWPSCRRPRARRRRDLDDRPAQGPPRRRGRGTRAYAIGFQDGRFYANGWHITGEMGGIWAPPLKLADGVWFGIDDEWVGPATRFTSGRGYVRYALPPHRRRSTSPAPTSCPTAAAPRCSGSRSPTRRDGKTVTVKVDVHSELLGAYPWTGSKGHPTAADNLTDIAAYRRQRLVFTRPRHAARRPAARLRRARRLQPHARGRRDRRRLPRSAAGHGLRGRRDVAARGLRRRPARQGRRRPAALPRHGRPRAGRRRSGSRSRAPTAGSTPPARAQRRWTTRTPSCAPSTTTRDELAARSASTCPATAASGRRRLGQAEPRRPHADGRRTWRSASSTRARPTRRRSARSTARRSSAPATPTTRGCSPPTASTRRSPPSRSASSRPIEAHLRALREVSDLLNDRSRQGRARDRHRRLGLLRRQRPTRATPTSP